MEEYLEKLKSVVSETYSIDLDIKTDDKKNESEAKLSIDDDDKNDFLNFKLTNFIEKIENSNVDTYILLDYKSDNFLIKTSIFENFNYKKYDEINTKFDSEKIKVIFKFPSRPILLKQKMFPITFQILDKNKQYSSNILLKLVSNDFSFSESMLQLDSSEKKINVSKLSETISYQVKIKVYINNLLNETLTIDLWDRK